MKAIHFCDIQFYNELLNNKIILPIRDKIKMPSIKLAYDYLYDNFTDGKGVFFAWASEINKNTEIIFKKAGKYVMIELEVPDDKAILTDYYSWSDFIFFYNGDINETDKLVKEDLGIPVKDLLDKIFNVSESDTHQVLLKELNVDWIKSVKFVEGVIV